MKYEHPELAAMLHYYPARKSSRTPNRIVAPRPLIFSQDPQMDASTFPMRVLESWEAKSRPLLGDETQNSASQDDVIPFLNI